MGCVYSKVTTDFLNAIQSPSAVLWFSCVSLNPRFAGTNPAEEDGFLRAIKICSATSFEGELKPSVPCRKILRYAKEPPGSMKYILRRKNSRSYLAKFLLFRYYVSLLVNDRQLLWMNQKLLTLRRGTHNSSVTVAVHGTICAIPPRNSNGICYSDQLWRQGVNIHDVSDSLTSLN
jgi:hypothetical protein